MSTTLLDWRRTVGDLYGRVRDCAQPEEGFEIWRSGRDRLFAEHPESPLEAAARGDFSGLPYAPYDPAYRFQVSIEPVEPARLDIGTQAEEVVRLERIGRVRLGELGTLDVWWLAQYGGGLFLPMQDTTAGRGTYGAGRYLLDTVKGADLGGDMRGGSLVVDLNFAYNPSCAYDPAWQCPLAQPGNVVTAELGVGELIG